MFEKDYQSFIIVHGIQHFWLLKMEGMSYFWSLMFLHTLTNIHEHYTWISLYIIKNHLNYNCWDSCCYFACFLFVFDIEDQGKQVKLKPSQTQVCAHIIVIGNNFFFLWNMEVSNLQQSLFVLLGCNLVWLMVMWKDRLIFWEIFCFVYFTSFRRGGMDKGQCDEGHDNGARVNTERQWHERLQ